MSFVDPASDGYSASISLIIHEISYNIGPRYNDTPLCMKITMTTTFLWHFYDSDDNPITQYALYRRNSQHNWRYITYCTWYDVRQKNNGS